MNSTDLYRIERLLSTNDPEVYQESSRHDALLLVQETGVLTRDMAVAAIRDESRENRRWADVTFTDERSLSPTEDTRLLIYRAAARWNHEQEPVTVLCSSVYALHTGETCFPSTNTGTTLTTGRAAAASGAPPKKNVG